MTEVQFLQEYPVIAINGRSSLFQGVTRESSVSEEDWVRLDYHGIEVNYTKNCWRLTELMVEELGYYNASYINSKGGDRATFALICPSTTVVSEDPTLAERQKQLGAWVFRDNIGYEGYSLSVKEAGSDVTLETTPVDNQMHVRAISKTRIIKDEESEGTTFLFASPGGVPTQSVTKDRPSTVVIVAYPENIKDYLLDTVVTLCDPKIEALFADLPGERFVAGLSIPEVNAGERYEISGGEEPVIVRSLEMLMLSLEHPEQAIQGTPEQKVYVGQVATPYEMTTVLTYEETSQVDIAETDITVSYPPVEDDGLYQIKSPLQHSTGVGRVSDLLIPVLPE